MTMLPVSPIAAPVDAAHALAASAPLGYRTELRRWAWRHRAPSSLLDQVLRSLHSQAADLGEADPPTVGEATEVPTAGPAADPAPDTGDGRVDARTSIGAAEISMEQLVRDHADAVYRVTLSITRDPMLAEDASQDTLIKAWQALPTFRGDAPLRNWVLRIAHNTAISLLRRRRDEIRDPDELPDPISPHTVESRVQDRLAIDRFEMALRELDSVSRSIVVLREVEGLSYDEICEVLQLPMPTIKTRLLRARRQLAVALEGWRP